MITQHLISLTERWNRARHGSKAQCIWIACFQKSASTYLAKLLRHITGYGEFNPVRSSGLEQHIYPPAFINGYWKKSVVQQHVRPLPENLTFFTRYGIRPIILTRNIFDVMVSLHEHIRDRSRQSHSYHVDESYDALDDKERMDGVIRFEAPWFFQFYVGWHNAVRRGDVDALWLTYEEFIPDRAGALRRIFDFLGMDVSDARIEQGLKAELKRTRFNVGVSGRGQDMLTEDQKERLRDFAKSYPLVDFSRMGL